jgi:hypothetical protein
MSQTLSKLNHQRVIFSRSIYKLSRNFDPVGSKRALNGMGQTKRHQARGIMYAKLRVNALDMSSHSIGT